MQIINDIVKLRLAVHKLRQNNQPVALVPTMGALHDGHLALVRAAQRYSDNVIVSIFVNPEQFGANEDLEKYPRQLENDAKKLRDLNVAILWAPTPEVIYPKDFATSMQIKGLDENLCGIARPGHFNGVILIVAKLFNQIGADLAFFGEKDYQQLAIIKQMARDLDFNVDIKAVPTVRDQDGLALSSRNIYLSIHERKIALALPQSLERAAAAIIEGGDIDTIIEMASIHMLNAGFENIDYISLVDAKSLEPIKKWRGEDARLLIAAQIGSTRLIDNIAIK